MIFRLLKNHCWQHFCAEFTHLISHPFFCLIILYISMSDGKIVWETSNLVQHQLQYRCDQTILMNRKLRHKTELSVGWGTICFPSEWASLGGLAFCSSLNMESFWVYTTLKSSKWRPWERYILFSRCLVVPQEVLKSGLIACLPCCQHGEGKIMGLPFFKRTRAHTHSQILLIKNPTKCWEMHWK